MSRTNREWSDQFKEIEDDDPYYGNTMKSVGKWARQGRDKSTISPGDKWERASKRAKKKGKRKQRKERLQEEDI